MAKMYHKPGYFAREEQSAEEYLKRRIERAKYANFFSEQSKLKAEQKRNAKLQANEASEMGR